MNWLPEKLQLIDVAAYTNQTKLFKMNNNVVAVATIHWSHFFERCRVNHGIVTSLKKLAPSQVDYFCLADRSVRVKCASDGTLQCKERVLFSKIL